MLSRFKAHNLRSLWCSPPSNYDLRPGKIRVLGRGSHTLWALEMPPCSRDTSAHCWLTLRATKLRSRLAAMKTNEARHNATSAARR